MFARRMVIGLVLALGLVGIYAASMVAPVSVRAFDRPGPSEGWGPWLFIVVMFTAPVLCFVCLAAGAYFFWRDRLAAGFVAAAVPAIVGALYLLVGLD